METNRKLILNLPEIIKDQSFLAITRMLATQLMENPYMTVGDFIGNLSDSDLSFLINTMEDSDKYCGDYILIGSMLAGAEGVPAPNDVEEYRALLHEFPELVELPLRTFLRSLGRSTFLIIGVATGSFSRGSLPSTHAALLLFAAGFVTAVATWASNAALALGLVSYVISVKRLSVVVSVLYGAIWFKEHHMHERLIGAAVMLLGVIIIAL